MEEVEKDMQVEGAAPKSTDEMEGIRRAAPGPPRGDDTMEGCTWAWAGWVEAHFRRELQLVRVPSVVSLKMSLES